MINYILFIGFKESGYKMIPLDYKIYKDYNMIWSIAKNFDPKKYAPNWDINPENIKLEILSFTDA